MYEKNVMPEKQALNSQKGLFYPVSQQSLNEIADIFLCVCEVFRGKFRNDVLRGDILLLTYIELRLFYLCKKTGEKFVTTELDEMNFQSFKRIVRSHR